jgi:hypothetical protein
MKLKHTFVNSKFPKKEYACYEDTWDSHKSYAVYEIVGEAQGQKLQMSKAQYENFELILKMNGWQQAA